MQQCESGAEVRAPQSQGLAVPGPLGGAPQGDLGLGLAPRMLADPIRWVCSKRRGRPS